MTLAINTKKPVNYITAGVLLVLAIIMVLVLKGQFQQMQTKETVYFGKNPNVVAVHKLSEWNSNLATTNNGAGDALVYEIKGDDDIAAGQNVGDTIVILGGVHANEPAGVVSATWLIENLHPKTGTVYVMMHTNEAGYTCTDPQEGSPMFFTIDTGSGDRIFRFGSRVTNPIYQWPDPDIYVHTSGMKLAGAETRNLNRCYPGIADGTITQQVAYAITSLVKDVDAAFEVDLHEASPEYKTINTTVYHAKGANIAAAASFNVPSDMDADSGKMGTDIAPESLRGLSHIELGTWTDTLSFLMETSNPSQGREHGKTGTNLVVTGIDKFYVRNQANVGLWDLTYGKDPTTGKNSTDQTVYQEVADGQYVDSQGNTVENIRALSQRCARHLTFVAALAQAYQEMVSAAKAEAALATTDADRAAIYDKVGMGYSVLDDTQIVGDRRTGLLDLGLNLTEDNTFYTHIRDELYGDLKPADGVLTSDDIWALDNSQFPVSVVGGVITPAN